MEHDTSLIAMIAVGLALAFVGGFIAVRLRLPPLLGYLLAGIAMGPYTPGFVGQAKHASQLAEVGVILLMFGVGMHFSIRDLWKVKSVAVPGAIVQIVAATAMGMALCWFWQWSLGTGLVFGLALSVASTVVLLRALEASNSLNSTDGHIAVGWLIVEDLVMVLALVLLPAFTEQLGGVIAEDQAKDANVWRSLGMTLGKVALFIAFMLIVGRRLFPWMLVRVERTGSRELFTLSVAALALGVTFCSAMAFDVSFALGAFFAGVVLSESALSHRASADLQSLQDAFGALFFVAVGMLFNPHVLWQQPLSVLAVLAIIMIGKSAAALLIVLALRRPMSTALLVSASLAQIGEFSFILAQLGMHMKVLTDEAQNLILAGALLSIALNPLLFYLAGRLRPPERLPALTPSPSTPATVSKTQQA